MNKYSRLVLQQHFVASPDISCAKLIGPTLIVLVTNSCLLLINQSKDQAYEPAAFP